MTGIVAFQRRLAVGKDGRNVYTSLRFVVPGIPVVLSVALSLWTAGSHLYWQDSGIFLVAVKELGVLYPPGFALYVLLCKAWTLLLRDVDVTYAVPEGLAAIITRMMSKDPKARYQTPAQVEAELEQWVPAEVTLPAAEEMPQLSPAATDVVRDVAVEHPEIVEQIQAKIGAMMEGFPEPVRQIDI